MLKIETHREVLLCIHMSLQDLRDSLVELFDMANIDYDDVIISYGYLGDLLPEHYFQKAYTFEHIPSSTDQFLGEWSIEMLKIKTFSTGSEYLIETYGEVHLIFLSTFVTSYHENAPVIYALHDEKQERVFIVNDTFKILRCITFEKYIRSANMIKKAWKKYQERKKQACVIIQRAVLRHLYRPQSPFVSRFKSHFISLQA